MPVSLTGSLICADDEQARIVRSHLPEHIRLTRAEPGCEMFEVTPASDWVWNVAERFTDRAAFDAHQARTKASAWGQATLGIKRDFTLRED
jgi:quinol monooxygenase YgiN